MWEDNQLFSCIYIYVFPWKSWITKLSMPSCNDLPPAYDLSLPPKYYLVEIYITFQINIHQSYFSQLFDYRSPPILYLNKFLKIFPPVAPHSFAVPYISPD